MAKRARSKIKVVLVDEHPVVRRGIEVSLERRPGLTVIAQGSSVDEAFSKVEDEPDVVVVDVALLAEAIREIRSRFPGVGVVAFTSTDDQDSIREAVTAGARGFLSKSSSAEELIRAIEAIRLGDVYFGAPASRVVAETYLRDATEEPGLSDLSAREIEVLKLVAEGRTSRDIAEYLGLSIRTIDSHRVHIMQKLDIHTVAGLTRFAIAQGLIEMD